MFTITCNVVICGSRKLHAKDDNTYYHWGDVIWTKAEVMYPLRVITALETTTIPCVYNNMTPLNSNMNFIKPAVQSVAIKEQLHFIVLCTVS